MDRRDHPQTGDGHADDSLRRALALIVKSYEDRPAGELYREAIFCFDSLIDISRNTEMVKEFAIKNGIDLKYLVDGANFVISKMHFNPEGNYYITLGVPDDASQEDIRERWKRLMLLYHPDLQADNEEWVSERAKKVNEAYATLKNSFKRRSYDKGLMEQERTSGSSSRPRSAHRSHPVSRGGIREGAYEDWSGVRRYLPRLIIAVYILGAFIFLLFMYYRNSRPPLENELRPANGTSVAGAAMTASSEDSVPDKGTSPARKDKMEVPAGGPSVNSQTSAAGDVQADMAETVSATPVRLAKTEPSQPPYRKHKPESGKVKNKAVVSDNKDVPRAVKAEVYSRPSKEVLAAAKGDDLKREDSPAVPSVHTEAVRQEPKKGKEISAAGTVPEPAVLHKAETGTRASLKRDHITEAEVEGFIRRYSAAYEKGDLREFMPFFSTSATENNMHYDAIRRSYMDTFKGRTKSHHLEKVHIRLEGRTADVHGIYNVVRFESARNKWEHYRGNIHWKLEKENGRVKIIYSHYDK